MKNMNFNLFFFCSQDESRPNLLKPMSKGGFTFASDGRIAIRVERIESSEQSKHQQTVDALESLFASESFKVEVGWIPVIEPTYTRRCCAECGSLLVASIDAVEVGNKLIGSYYINKMMLLPNCQINPTDNDRFSPMPFRFDGGIGLIMPIRK